MVQWSSTVGVEVVAHVVEEEVAEVGEEVVTVKSSLLAVARVRSPNFNSARRMERRSSPRSSR